MVDVELSCLTQASNHGRLNRQSLQPSCPVELTLVVLAPRPRGTHRTWTETANVGYPEELNEDPGRGRRSSPPQHRHGWAQGWRARDQVGQHGRAGVGRTQDAVLPDRD